jgi:hypothetical protein
LRAVGVRWDDVTFPVSSTTPAFVPTVRFDGSRHFLALLARSGGEILVVDVPHQPYWVSESTFRERYQWNGYVLHLAASRIDLVGVYWAMFKGRALIIGGVILVMLVALRGLRHLRSLNRSLS